MKNLISRLPLLLGFSMFLITCQSPVKERISFGPKWIEEMTISQLQKGYSEGRFTIAEVVRLYLDRIGAIDKNGPALNSVLMINPDAMAIAEELDRELAAGKKRGPMHGVPVILKDNIDTNDGMPTTAGSLALKNSFPSKDSFVAKKLREAGAVILGKSNLSEWANFRAETSSSGWSAVGGQTKNPYVLDRNPCGSSSGSGVAVSANLCMIAIGTETNGSIVCPSTSNGIVGIKPTVGLISRTGIIPISFTQDTPGPMARTVADAATALGVLTGIDARDAKTFGSEGKSLTDYTVFLKENGLTGKRIGLLRKTMGFSDRVDTLMLEAVSFLRSHGAEVIDIEVPRTENYNSASMEVMLYEFKDGLNSYLAGLTDVVPVKTLADLIAFNKNDSIELKYFDQKLLEMAGKKGSLEDKEYKEALSKMLKATREEGIDKVMDSNRLDAIMAPTGSAAWKTDLILGDHFTGGSSSLAAISGYPAITVPMGFVNDLPVGVTFFGRAWSEGTLLTIAYGYEQGTKHRKTPGYIPSDN
jgi:amidase